MRIFSFIAGVSLALWFLPSLVVAQDDSFIADMAGYDVILLGEVHDNPGHHARQKAAIAALQPTAVVWEMLTEAQASRITKKLILNREKLEQALEWAQSGWPSFALYHPIFLAAPDAQIFAGNLSRRQALSVLEGGPSVAFGDEAKRFGLKTTLSQQEETVRKVAQLAAHCGAIAPDRLMRLVNIQRLRDAVMARAVETAIRETGGPVVVITGNGHARKDWGIPVYLARVAPELTVFALGQSEAGQIAGEFDLVLDSPMVDRADPCDAFRDKS